MEWLGTARFGKVWQGKAWKNHIHIQGVVRQGGAWSGR